MNASDFAKYLQRMIALTDTGLTFTKDPFDRERYEDLRSLLSEMLNQASDLDAEEVAEVLKPTSAYATPLMDVVLGLLRTKRFVWLGDKERMIGLCQVALARSVIHQLKIFSRKLKKKPVLKPKLNDY